MTEACEEYEQLWNYVNQPNHAFAMEYIRNGRQWADDLINRSQALWLKMDKNERDRFIELDKITP